MTRSPNVLTEQLDHGLRAVAVELPHLHTATLSVFVKTGPRHETPEQNGLSHFVEHMLYRGTQRFPSSFELNRAFEALGGTLVAETGRDYSSFSTSTAPDGVCDGLDLLGELMSHPRFDDIELERALILEELNEDFGEDGEEINGTDIARALAFGDHPLAQRIIGPRANVLAFSRDDVVAHFTDAYGASNMIVAVAGPIDAAATVAEIARRFSDVPEGTPAPAAGPPPAPACSQLAYIKEPGLQTGLDLVWPSIPETDPAYMASVALARVIDDGMSTRLHYRLADQLGLAYSINAGIEPLHDTAVFDVSAATANSKAVELTRRILDLTAELTREPVGGDELAKVKRRYRHDLASSIDDAGAMASWFGATRLFYVPPPLEDRVAQMDQVTQDDILEASQRVFSPAHLSAAAVGALSPARVAELRELITASDAP